MLHYNRLERLVTYKPTSLFYSSVSYEENEVLWIWSLTHWVLIWICLQISKLPIVILSLFLKNNLNFWKTNNNKKITETPFLSCSLCCGYSMETLSSIGPLVAQATRLMVKTTWPTDILPTHIGWPTDRVKCWPNNASKKCLLAKCTLAKCLLTKCLLVKCLLR